MGIKPFLVASSIQAIMAQRLLRTICAECKTIDPAPDKFILRMLGITQADLAGKNVYHGTGCQRCGDLGYRGRQGIFEMLEMNNELRELAFNRSPTNLMRRAARCRRHALAPRRRQAQDPPRHHDARRSRAHHAAGRHRGNG